MIRALALLLAILPAQVLAAASWSLINSPINPRCGNYCDVDGTRTADSNNGSSATGDFWLGSINGGSPSKVISRERMRSAGIKDTKGRLVDYIRTIGIDGDYAMMHVGPGTSWYMPVLASRKSGSWQPVGPVKINNKVRESYSSSMAFEQRDGVFWMIQDSITDYPGLRAFKSSNGIDWSPVGGNIQALTGDTKAAYPDLIYYGGRWHLVYTQKWDVGNVRHLSSADMINWRVEAKTAAYAFKGCNWFVDSGGLGCHSSGKAWRVKVGNEPEPVATSSGGGSCAALDVSVAERDAAVSWTGTCIHKFVNTTNGSTVFFGKANGGKTHANLPYGSYKAMVREPISGAPYTSKTFTIDGGGSTTAAVSSGSPCSSPSASGGAGAITVSWSGGGPCVVKLVGPTGKWLSGVESGDTIGGLAAGTYKVRVKPSGGVYKDVTNVQVKS